ncbi:L-lactate dehydrogenase complex protein LldE [Catalinimonas alkaloidigena]|uniref:L-lactate dehydrogenase complex protein LldE n=1 Tax=Catalinimonas alkaloidigena TaxID=1075417 RepID=A0A1G9KKB0_9BACT|nr:(Fe-S)-binding protein [Catalinimonas alkaloidigena]SDL50250.1 L-lactate dehydrogenase complex protein LldE [Catalinimonas alkaloidigena]
MNVALFVPCYVDQFYPQVAIATLELLEKLGCTVHVPQNQTCCGQPMANSGCEMYTPPVEQLFVENFKDYDYIVAPSGSCALHVKEHFHGDGAEVAKVKSSIYDLVEFLTDVLEVNQLDARFPYRVGYHASCHGLRMLKLGTGSERNVVAYSKPHRLLELVKDLEVVPLDRIDECCGFGGTFAVFEEAVSVKMGKDRLSDHLRHGAEVVTGGDMSCLMHMEGILRRQKSPVKVMHIAEILNHV